MHREHAVHLLCLHDGNVVNTQNKQCGTRRERFGSERGRAFVLCGAL